ncbi:MAG: twin-arginine translocase TatA/TatE family subunit [Pseudoclavibacter sp.]
MFQNLSGWHYVIQLVIILLQIGAPSLPALARSLGQSFRILKGEVRSDDGTGGSAQAGGAQANAGQWQQDSTAHYDSSHGSQSAPQAQATPPFQANDAQQPPTPPAAAPGTEPGDAAPRQ